MDKGMQGSILFFIFEAIYGLYVIIFEELMLSQLPDQLKNSLPHVQFVELKSRSEKSYNELVN